jgi:hypothetical protein
MAYGPITHSAQEHKYYICKWTNKNENAKSTDILIDIITIIIIIITIII